MKTLIYLLALAMIATSCLTPQKAVHYLKKRNLLADTCAANFPVRDSLVTRDSVRVDTVYSQPEDYIAISPETPASAPQPSRVQKVYITKTLIRDSVHYVRDQAQEAVLRKDADDQAAAARASLRLYTLEQVKVRDRDDTISKLRKREFYLILIIIALSAFIFRRPLLSLLSVFNPLKLV